MQVQSATCAVHEHNISRRVTETARSLCQSRSYEATKALYRAAAGSGRSARTLLSEPIPARVASLELRRCNAALGLRAASYPRRGRDVASSLVEGPSLLAGQMLLGRSKRRDRPEGGREYLLGSAIALIACPDAWVQIGVNRRQFSSATLPRRCNNVQKGGSSCKRTRLMASRAHNN